MKPTTLLFLLTYFSLVPAQAQLSEIQAKKIDSLFNTWTEGNHPGGTIGIMQKGEVIYSKAFGMASLEYQVPNTTETLFNLASVSKQLTAMGIVLLEERGLLSIDDDIRKHLPDLPDFGHTITIRHMLHHTSGMRSLHAMLRLAGWRSDDSRTNEDLYRFMLNQKDLNFIPGDEYLYCNTGYILMANIIENLTDEKFPEWMQANIFNPLGMTNTYVEDRYDRVVPDNATSYHNRRGDFFRAVEFWAYIGSGNVHSTTADLLIWLQNFSTPPADWKSAFERLKTTDDLNDGSKNNYAFGVNIGQYNGYDRISHGGSIGGFRAYASHYPEEELSIAVLTNFSSSNSGGIEKNIAGILLKNKANPTVFSETKDQKTPLLKLYQKGNKMETEKYVEEDLSSISLSDYTGRFYSPELESNLDFILKDGDLIAHHVRHGDFSVELIKKDALEIQNFASIEVVRDSENIITGIKVSNGRARNVWFEKQ